MTLQRLMGIVLFWGGFLAAAVCMVLQRDIDLLPDAERQVLSRLPDTFSVPATEASRRSQLPISELDTTDFVLMINDLEAWWLAQQTNQSSLGPETEDIEQQDNSRLPPPIAPSPETPAAAPSPDRRAAPLTKDYLIKRRVARLPSLWPAVYWPGYLAAVVVGIGGAVLIRASSKSATSNESLNQAGLEQLTTVLQALVVEVDRLTEALPTLAPEEAVPWIDTHCVPLCADFADNREVMKTTFGLAGFAAVMSEFASGERFLNRVWSAAADGYMEEAWRSIQTSQRFFHKALEELQQRRR
jgi:hypothetical protein